MEGVGMLSWSAVAASVLGILLVRWFFKSRSRFRAEYDLCGLDRMYFALDRDPQNLPLVHSMVVVDGQVDYESMKARVTKEVMRFRRFRSVPKVVGGALWWRKMAWVECDVDWDYHLVVHTLPSPGTQEQLEDLLNTLMNCPLDRTHPLWRSYLIYGINDGKQTGSLLRIHHAISDGLGLVGILMRTLDCGMEGVMPITRSQRRPSLYSSLPHTQRVVQHPLTFLYRSLLTFLKTIHAVVKVIVYFVTSDVKTCFKGPLSTEKCVAWSKPYDLQRVKELGRRLNGTVNDVLQTAITGALRRVMIEHGTLLKKGTTVSAVLPFNMRPTALDAPTPDDVCNRFALLFVPMPVGKSTPLGRFRQQRANNVSIKNGMEPTVNTWIMSVLGNGPPDLLLKAFSVFTTGATLLLSNVAAPQTKMTLLGNPLDHMFFFVPQAGDIGLGMSIGSMSGKVVVAVLVDKNLYGTPRTLISYLDEELDALDRASQE